MTFDELKATLNMVQARLAAVENWPNEVLLDVGEWSAIRRALGRAEREAARRLKKAEARKQEP